VTAQQLLQNVFEIVLEQGRAQAPPIECCLALLRTNNDQVSDF